MSEATSSSGTWSPFEVLLLVFGLVAASASTVLWLGAALAIVITAGSPTGLRWSDGLRAAAPLADHPSDPSAAFAHLPTGAVPGPWVFWPCVVVVAVLVIGLALAARAAWRGMRPARHRLGVDVRARFATRRELRPLLIPEPVPGRFVIGRWGRWLVATESRRWAPAPSNGWRWLWARLSGEVRRRRDGDTTSIAVIGPTGCGKTSEFAIPGVLDWVGPAILLSVKRDLMDSTIERRRKLGKVRVFDPGGFLQENPNARIQVGPEELARWSPLRNAHTPTGAKKAGAALAAWTPKAGVEGGTGFWETQGKLLFSGLLGAAALSEARSMRKVAEWVFNMDMPRPRAHCEPASLVSRFSKHEDTAVAEAAKAASLHLSSIWDKPDDKLRASVYATAQTVCDPWLDPAVAAATDPPAPRDKRRADREVEPDLGADSGEGCEAGGWVDLDWLMETGPEGSNANTLYLLVSQDDFDRLAPVLAGLLSDLKAQVYQWDATGRRLPAPLLMLIDEAGNIPLDWLPEVSSTCRGLGLQLVTIWQSLAQIHEAYGRRADVLLTNHPTKLFFPGASDDSTLSYQSKIVGDEEVERQSWSRDLAGGSARRSISGQLSRESLVPYFLARLPEFGSALMIHSNTPPAQITGRRWWKIPRLAAMVPAGTPHPVQTTHRGPWEPYTRDAPTARVPAPALASEPDESERKAVAA